MNRIEKIVEEIELEYLEGVNSNIEKRREMLPLTDKEQIKPLIWNLTHNKKYKERLSMNDFMDILDIWINRLTNV